MYSKMLRQSSKGSIISISSDSSKIHLLIKVLYRHIWSNLCRRYFLFHALSVSVCYLAAVQLYNVLVLRSLDVKYFSFANVSIPVPGVNHISNLLTVCMKMLPSSRTTQPLPFTSKCQICQKLFITSDIKLV